MLGLLDLLRRVIAATIEARAIPAAAVVALRLLDLLRRVTAVALEA